MRKFISRGLAIIGFVSFGIAFYLIVYGLTHEFINSGELLAVGGFIFIPLAVILLLISAKYGRKEE